MSKLNLTNLQKAFNQYLSMYTYYQEHINVEDSISKDAVKESLVQRFEYCEELFWKTLRRFLLDKKGLNIEAAPKTVYRSAGQLNILKTEQWFKFLEMRNKTSHLYGGNTLDHILGIVDEFAKYGQELINYLEQNNED